VARTEIEGSYRLPSFENARVADAMHPGVVSCTPETSLRTLAQIMAQHHIHSVVVSGVDSPDSARDWAVVTDVDLLRASSGDVDAQEAREIAATELPLIESDETLPRAAQVMAEHEVTHLIVVNDERAVGVLSSLDVAGILAWGRA
jgi:CBS domain-containing protein